MNRQHLLKQSKSYAIVKKYAVTVHDIFYSEICIRGEENIPAGEPVIFVPNHQNGLMDALAAGLPLKNQPVYMARADIFGNPVISSFLNFIKIIPVFRLKDGADKLGKNDESFSTALEVLKHLQPVIIMPEGGHSGIRMLKPLKKGVVRFALDAIENLNTELKIIPVGIDYSNYHNFRSKLLVIYGEPVNVSGFLRQYNENPQIAYNILRNKISGELKEIMLNIDNQEYYDLIMRCREIFVNQLFEEAEADYFQKFTASKKITDRLNEIANNDPGKLLNLRNEVDEYTAGLLRIKLEDNVFDSLIPNSRTIWFDTARYLFFLPFFTGTVLMNIIPAFICSYIAEKAEDPQFKSSFKYGLGAIVFPAFYLLFLLVFPLPLYTKILVMLPMPVLIPLAYDYYISVRKGSMKIRYFRLLKQNKLNELRVLRDRILRTIDELM